MKVVAKIGIRGNAEAEFGFIRPSVYDKVVNRAPTQKRKETTHEKGFQETEDAQHDSGSHLLLYDSCAHRDGTG